MKVISFSLWGDNPRYCVGAVKNAILANEIYEGWTSRFYCGKSVPPKTLDQLKSIDNSEVVFMNEEGNWTSSFWRFLPASDSDTEMMLSRDCDSRLSPREKAAVEEWIRSNESFHIMRDHPFHLYEILGGMWGVKYPKLKKIKEIMDDFKKDDTWGIDQIFLKERVYPIIRDDCMVHDSFYTYDANAKQFPTERKGMEFVGEIFDENDNPHPQHRSVLKNYLSL